MRKIDVPTYNDPVDFENGCDDQNNPLKFPNNTQYMVYDTLLRRYKLTEAGLNRYVPNWLSRYIPDDPNNAWQELSDKVSKKIYDYIHFKVGIRLYNVMLYRIATAPPEIYPSKYIMRKQFEEALGFQAKWIVTNNDTGAYSSATLENLPDGQASPAPETVLRDISDMSKEAVRTLEALRLTRWFQFQQFVHLDENKF